MSLVGSSWLIIYFRFFSFGFSLIYLQSLCGEKIQLDATQCFIELIIRSTCFRHYYAHHQELETIQVMWHITLCCSNKIPQPGRIAHSPHQTTRPALNKVLCAACCNHLYSLELLMMGIIVPEICCAYYKFNKPLCSI